MKLDDIVEAYEAWVRREPFPVAGLCKVVSIAALSDESAAHSRASPGAPATSGVNAPRIVGC